MYFVQCSSILLVSCILIVRLGLWFSWGEKNLKKKVPFSLNHIRGTLYAHDSISRNVNLDRLSIKDTPL